MPTLSREEETEECMATGMYTDSQCQTFGRCVTVSEDYGTLYLSPFCYPADDQDDPFDDGSGNMICQADTQHAALDAYCYGQIGDPIETEPPPPPPDDDDDTPPDNPDDDSGNDCGCDDRKSSYCRLM